MIKNNDIRSLIDDSDYEEATSLLKKDYAYQTKQFKRIWYLANRFEEPEAYYNLALLYLLGIGTEKNMDMMVASFKRAANLNHIKSILLVAKLYLYGLCLESNYQKVTIYLQKLFKLITSEDGKKYNNYIYLLIYLLSLESYETSIEFVIKNDLVNLIRGIRTFEFDGVEYELSEEYNKALLDLYSKHNKIINIKNRITKTHNLELVKELIKLLDEDNPKHNVNKLRELESRLPVKEGSNKALELENLLVEIINCILKFKEYGC